MLQDFSDKSQELKIEGACNVLSDFKYSHVIHGQRGSRTKGEVEGKKRTTKRDYLAYRLVNTLNVHTVQFK